MSELPDLRDKRAPPVIFILANVIWKIIGAWSNINFLLAMRDDKFSSVFQLFLNQGWWIAVLFGIVWMIQATKEHTENLGGIKTVGWGMVFSIGFTAFLFGVLIATYATASFPNVIPAFGGDTTGCNAIIDTSRLADFKDKYFLLLVCGQNDATVDMLQDTRIAISSPFTITGGGVTIVVPYKSDMAALADKYKSTWHMAVLVPKDVDMSHIKTLADVPKEKGKILAQNLF